MKGLAVACKLDHKMILFADYNFSCQEVRPKKTGAVHGVFALQAEGGAAVTYRLLVETGSGLLLPSEKGPYWNQSDAIQSSSSFLREL